MPLSAQLPIGLALGFVLALAAVGVAAPQPAGSLAGSPRMGFGMMMPMMRTGSGCSLNDDQLAELGEQLMAQMIGDERLHEQMDAQMRDERAMHILMAKMMTGCR